MAELTCMEIWKRPGLIFFSFAVEEEKIDRLPAPNQTWRGLLSVNDNMNKLLETVLFKMELNC